MYALPLAVVGLQLVMIQADPIQISKCYMIASVASLVGSVIVN